MRRLFIAVLCVLASLVSFASFACGGQTQETDVVIIHIMTSGGAGYGGQIVASGAASKDIAPTGKDTTIRMKADKDPAITGTVTRWGEVGRVDVTVSVDGKVVFEGVANDQDQSVNIVLR